MWTAAKMLRPMDFVFHRVMVAPQRGSRVIIIATLALIIAFNLLFNNKLSLCLSSYIIRTLDVGSNMTFGGLRDIESILLHPAQIKTHDFVGCIRNIHVNGILLKPSMAFAAYNILDR